MDKHKVFVYGTLKKGFGNHRLLVDSEKIGDRTLADHDIYAVSGFPGVVPGTDTVEGELYEVDSETLRRLDALEGHPHMYTRTEVVLSDGTKAETYIWQRAVRPETQLNGVWPGGAVKRWHSLKQVIELKG